MEKITRIIHFAGKLMTALIIVGGMVFIITVNSVCRTAYAAFTSAFAYGLLLCSFFFFYFYHSQNVTCDKYEEHIGAKGGRIRTISFHYTMNGKLMNGEAYVIKKYNTGQQLHVIICDKASLKLYNHDRLTRSLTFGAGIVCACLYMAGFFV